MTAKFVPLLIAGLIVGAARAALAAEPETDTADSAVALSEQKAARAEGFKLMVGCMVGTSLSMAPAMLLAQDAEFVDLDGPLLLAHDRQPGLRYEGSTVFPPKPNLWG